MANEAGVAIVVSMRDEASTRMQQLGRNMQQTRAESINFRLAIMAVGGVLMHMSSLLNQIDSPLAKSASSFLRMAGYVLMTASSIAFMIPQVAALITWLRQLAVAQAIVAALSGPKGWIALGVAAAVGTGAMVTAATMSRNQREAQTVSRTTVVNNNIAGSVITERELGDITRREIIKTQQRSSSSGIK